MGLQQRIDERRREIRTDGYPVSIGEWISLYERSELDIHPEFQRFFRWSNAQKTSLIESVLLGIPIPSIFVSQRADGVWDVVDGLQRLSTIFQFVGILKGENGKSVPPLVLEATKYVPELKGVTWDGDAGEALPLEARLIFKRSKINSSIILRESDENAKYDLFQRLNTGGSQASDQEVRNCLLVMLNPDLLKWMKSLSEDSNFQDCIAISDRTLLEAYDLELVLRFLIFYQLSEAELSSVGDVGVFLTERMRIIAADKRYNATKNKAIFQKTFSLLNDKLSDSSFKRFNVERQKFQGGFAVSQFEAVACGVGYNIAKGIKPTNIAEKVAGLWTTPAYTTWTGSGVTAARRLPKLIPLGRQLFAD
jgi:hypothetical protein